jgi:hypothetical protein
LLKNHKITKKAVERNYFFKPGLPLSCGGSDLALISIPSHMIAWWSFNAVHQSPLANLEHIEDTALQHLPGLLMYSL